MQPRAIRVWLPIAIVATALALRLGHLWAMRQGPFSPDIFLPIDARLYHQWAIDWLAGAWPPVAPFERPPLYIWFVGCVYAVLGSAPVAVLLIQAALGSLLCWVVYDVARMLFDDLRVAAGSAVAAAISGPLIYFDAQLLSGSLDVFLQIASLWCVLRGGQSSNPASWIAAGLLIALSAINRGVVLLWLPFILLWIWLPPRWREQRKAGALLSIALLAPLAITVGPVAWRNARLDEPHLGAASTSETLARLVSGRFVMIASNSGINFYLGNHPVLRDLNRLDHPEHMQHYDRIRMAPVNRAITAYSALNEDLLASTLRHMANSPAAWLRLMGTKLAELVNGTEITRNTSLYADRGDSPILWLLLWRTGLSFPNGLVIPFGLTGLFLARHRWREQLPAMTSLLVHSIFIVAYFVTARYRLPMLPVLGIYAVYAGVSLYDRIRDGASASATRLAVGLIAAGLLANLPIVQVNRHHSYVDHFDLAVMLMDQDRLPDALEHLERSAEIEPAAPNVAIARCRLTLQIRGATDAVEVCKGAVRLDPFAANAHYLLGTALEQLQRPAEAVGHFKLASEIEPTDGGFRRALDRARRSSRRKLQVDGR